MHPFVSLLVILTLAAAAADRDCGSCTCSKGHSGSWKDLILAFCYNKDLTEIPGTDSLPQDIQILDIRRSSITSLESDQFKSFKGLQIIFVTGSKINVIQKHAFRNMKNVTDIALYDNSIAELPTELFADTPNLTLLWLNDNKLTKLQTYLFANLTYLKEIHLKRNQITTIEYNCFVNVPLLTKLFLNNNSLTSLHLNPTILNSLDVLYLQDNPWHCNTSLCEMMNATVSRDLWDIDATPTCTTPKNLQTNTWSEVEHDLCGLCSPCRCVDNFSVAECTGFLELTSVPDSLPENITVLYVTDQKITHLKENQFTNLEELEELHLERNNIKVINPEAFQNLKNLTLVTLTDNSITQLQKDTFSFTPKLTKLWLNKNNLTALHKFQFSNLPSLQEIDFSYNKINIIEDNSFINVSSLQTINLSFNHLQKLQLSIIDDSNSLMNLYLNGNPWQCDDSLCEVMNAVVSGRISTGDNNPTCAAPQKLKGKQWHQIYEDFQPRIISNISSVEEGHDITLQCKYCFVSNIMWTFNGIKLSRNVQQVSDTGLLSTLTVKSARQEEQGYYVCHVDDCRRCEDAWRHVKVRGKDTVDTKEVFHITANLGDNYNRGGVVLLSCSILDDKVLPGKEVKN